MMSPIQLCAWNLDRLAQSTVLADDVRLAAKQAAYVIREIDVRPEDAAQALHTITEMTR